MPSRRVQVTGTGNGGGLRPAAAPRSTYVRPNLSAVPNGALELAEALKSFTPAVNSYLERYATSSRDKTVSQAEQQAKTLNDALTYAEAVRQGKAPAHKSPLYRQAFDQTKGRVAGFNYDAELNNAYDAFIAEHGRNPDANIVDFINQTRSKFLADAKASPDFLAGFGDRQEAAENAVLNRFQADHPRALKAAQEAQIGQEFTLALQHYGVAKADPKRAADPAVDAELVNTLFKRPDFDAKLALIDKESLHKIQTDAVVAYAINRNDPELLNILEQGGDNGPATTPYAVAKVAEARSTIASNLENNLRAQDYLEQRALKRKQLELTDAAVERFINQGPTARFDDLVKQGKAAGIDLKSLVSDISSIRDNTKPVADPAALASVSVRIYNGQIRDAGAIARSVLSAGGSDSDVRAALGTLKSVTDDDPSNPSIQKRLPDVHSIGASVRTGVLQDGKLTSLFPQQQAILAQRSFYTDITTYAKQHPNASETELRDYAFERAGKLVDQYGKSATGVPAQSQPPKGE